METLTKTETPENEVTPASLSIAVPAPSATDIATTRSVPMAADTSASLTKRVTRKRKAPLPPPENTENPPLSNFQGLETPRTFVLGVFFIPNFGIICSRENSL